MSPGGEEEPALDPGEPSVLRGRQEGARGGGLWQDCVQCEVEGREVGFKQGLELQHLVHWLSSVLDRWSGGHQWVTSPVD